MIDCLKRGRVINGMISLYLELKKITGKFCIPFNLSIKWFVDPGTGFRQKSSMLVL